MAGNAPRIGEGWEGKFLSPAWATITRLVKAQFTEAGAEFQQPMSQTQLLPSNVSCRFDFSFPSIDMKLQ